MNCTFDGHRMLLMRPLGRFQAGLQLGYISRLLLEGKMIMGMLRSGTVSSLGIDTETELRYAESYVRR